MQKHLIQLSVKIQATNIVLQTVLCSSLHHPEKALSRIPNDKIWNPQQRGEGFIATSMSTTWLGHHKVQLREVQQINSTDCFTYFHNA